MYSHLESFDGMYIRQTRRWFVVVLVAYAIVAIAFAWSTPAWQAPDEPAHYNYIAYIVERRALPVLEHGDYDQALIERLVGSRFSPNDGIGLLRYEFHQPPLYYLLAAPVYAASAGNLQALRMFSVLVGACAILLLYLCLELVFPTKTLIVVGATAFAALLPMHVSLLSSVSNDGLAELLVLAGTLLALSWMRSYFFPEHPVDSEEVAVHDVTGRKRLVLLGILLGLGMLTKVYAYALTPILLTAVGLVVWLNPGAQRWNRIDDSGGPARSWQTFWKGVKTSLWAAVPALGLGSVWWIRNFRIYGQWDFLGLGRHSLVVADQPRTIEWIDTNGLVAYGERAIQFTFRSFWGVFGWMGVFMDERVYTACYLFTGVIFLGVLWAIVRLISGSPDADMDVFQLWVLGLFGVVIIAVGLAYVWYNLEFVQHQGRYLFWGLLPIGTVVALGWREVMQPLQGWITAALASIVAVGVGVIEYLTDSLDEWTLLAAGCIVLVLLLQPLLLVTTTPGMLKRTPSGFQHWLASPRIVTASRWARVAMWSLPFALLFVLNLAIPRLYILPQLTP